MPREDISKKLNSKLMEQFKHKDWKIRKKAGDDVEGLLREAKMRIEPNGLNELMDAMKAGMKDPNKAVVKVFINLLGLLAEAIGAPVKAYCKKCFVPMLSNISDKQTLVRADVVAATNKWADAIGAEVIINYLGVQLSIENPESRSEAFKWINEHADSIPDADCSSLVKPLTLCLTDKSKAIRESSEAIIGIVMPITGYQEFLGATKDMKQAVQQTLKPILEKIKNSSGGGGGGAAPAKAAAPVKSSNKGDQSSRGKEKSQTREVEKKPVGGSFGKAALEKKKATQAPPARANKNVDEDEVRIHTLNKAKRQQIDNRNKWPINEVKGDHIEKL